MARMKLPVQKICTRCASVFVTHSKVAKYCPSCRKEVTKECRRRYFRKYYADNRDRLAEHHRRYREENAERVQEQNREYLLRTKDDPDRKARRRETYKRYRDSHKEKIREYNRKYREAHKDSEEFKAMLRASQAKSIAKAKMRKEAMSNVGTAIEFLKSEGKLLECERLHVRALNLPCGKREECYMNPRCKRCPKDGVFTYNFFT